MDTLSAAESAGVNVIDTADTEDLPAEDTHPATAVPINTTPDNPFANLSDDALEMELTHHAANINAANCRLLLMIAEFDRRVAWGHTGTRSCAHWLNWRCGIGLGAAREKLRVGHALQELTQTRDAFASGELSYSKARAITREATPENESCLLSYARNGSATHVERVTRLYRQQYTDAGATKCDFNDVALPAEDADSIDPAEAERQGAAHRHDHRQLHSHWDDDGCFHLTARLTPEQGAIVQKAIEAAVASLTEDRPDADPAVNPATEQSDRPRQPERHERDLSDARFELEISSRQRHFSNRRADALVLMAEALLQNTHITACTADRYQVVVHVDQQVLSKARHSAASGAPDSFIEQQTALPVETTRRLCCDAKLVAMLENGDEVLSVGRRSRAVPSAIRRALQRRDGGCQFPSCTASTRFIDAHHIQHWADGGETSLDNLVELCTHHHRLVHEGGFSVARVDGELRFSRPDGTTLPNTPNTCGSDKTIDNQGTDGWSWSGDTMDYSVAVNALHWYDSGPGGARSTERSRGNVADGKPSYNAIVTMHHSTPPGIPRPSQPNPAPQ